MRFNSLFFFLVIVFVGCNYFNPVLTVDNNGEITHQQVQQVAGYLELNLAKNSDDELRLARDMAITRELAKRAREQGVDKEEAVHYLLETYIPNQLKVKLWLAKQVDTLKQKGIPVVTSRAYIQSTAEIPSARGDFSQNIDQLYQSIVSGKISFSEVLTKAGQPLQFTSLPVAVFPVELRRVLLTCSPDNTKVLKPVIVSSTWFIIECQEIRWALPRQLKELPDISPEQVPILLQAEDQRLQENVMQLFQCGTALPKDWQHKSVLFIKDNASVTLNDFSTLIRFESWRRNIHPRKIMAHFAVLQNLFETACLQSQVLAAARDAEVSVEQLSFEREAALARVMMVQMVADQKIHWEKVLDTVKTQHTRSSENPIIKEAENKVLRDIGFRFL